MKLKELIARGIGFFIGMNTFLTAILVADDTMAVWGFIGACVGFMTAMYCIYAFVPKEG